MKRWRSLLFVPANNARLLERAHSRGADALILDLEDALPLADKPEARGALPAAIDLLSGQGAVVLVRINSEAEQWRQDLDAAVCSQLSAVLVPKVDNAQQLRRIDAELTELERQRNLTPGAIGLIALIESPAALFRLEQIAAVPRMIGLALGSEDFSLALQVRPAPPALMLPCQWLALAAAAHGLMALGVPDSLAGFQDLSAWRAAARSARAIGMTGALCIHPAQIAEVNTAFMPSEQELDWARAVMAVWRPAQAAGQGVATLDGAMIDLPVAQRASAILALAASAPLTN